ncbi:MAG TPA: hypothetical protein VMV31_14295 [Terriglobales bacterium]|nr:hypothetical protein [Terriglobales bacterium]
MRILTINTGSSSIKAAVYALGAEAGLARESAAEAKSLGDPAAFAAALPGLLPPRAPDAIGHRIVAPLDWSQPQRLDAARLQELRARAGLAPDHLPQALAAMEALARTYPGVAQVACSDSAFHRSLPAAARTFALPRALQAEGVVRYGYHGLSCEYILSVLRAEDERRANGRIVIAHLGHGASLTAVHHGASMDTTMGFTPLGGVPMSTRSGDLDPGILLYLLRQKAMAPEALSRMLNQESGLLGVSGISGDMKTLVERSAREPAAAAAVEIFVYQVRKAVGALAAALGGLDLLVFTGGIGENAAAVRERIARGLEWIPMQVRVIPTDEDQMIARHTARALADDPAGQRKF